MVDGTSTSAPAAEPSGSATPATSGSKPGAPASIIYLPAPAVPLQPPGRVRLRRTGLLVAGGASFGAVYLVSSVVFGLIFLFHGSRWPYECDLEGCPPEPPIPLRRKLVFIPALGPFIAASAADSPGPYVGLGVLELSTLAMMIVGAVQYSRDRRAGSLVGLDGFGLGKRVRLGIQPTRFLGGGVLTLGGRF